MTVRIPERTWLPTAEDWPDSVLPADSFRYGTCRWPFRIYLHFRMLLPVPDCWNCVCCTRILRSGQSSDLPAVSVARSGETDSAVHRSSLRVRHTYWRSGSDYVCTIHWPATDFGPKRFRSLTGSYACFREGYESPVLCIPRGKGTYRARCSFPLHRARSALRNVWHAGCLLVREAKKQPSMRKV